LHYEINGILKRKNGEWAACLKFPVVTTLPPSYAKYLEIWEPQPPGTLRACPGL
jgi:hypothetical protein